MAKILKCALLDDELPGLAYLKLLCEQVPDLEVVKAFADPSLFVAQIKSLEVDFCIIDIEMPHFNGLQIANLIAGIPVIFATAYRDYAPEAFDLNAVDYLRKPVSQERLVQAIGKVRDKIQTPGTKLVAFNTPKGKTILPLNQIAIIQTSQSDSRDKVVTLQDGSQVLIKNKSISALLALLSQGEMIQVNKGELVRLDQVHYFIHDEITTHQTNDQGKPITLTLGEKFRMEFMARIQS
ncbi:LytTR family DNA-binding domain-containing protein [Algoriphagus sp. AK58]|uniref:LytR/AlgR family response regulator transcription factor n=1 Tax=Algoriphagus sp. AK58 TaxID=1406877 RepID=UPI00164F708B|nr:response regulator [Algoriphagus sp. AK58]MBC6366025.1 two-component system response regulator [Algoriphagus sp. AK58]